MYFRYRTFRPGLGLIPRVLLAAAIATVLILATVGAVIGLGLLAAGAVVHAIVRQFRGPSIAGASSTPSPAVIDGEFVVVKDAKQLPKP